MNLFKLKKGQSGTVHRIDAPNNIKRRLLDMGLTENTMVTCVETSPLGDPKAFLIRGAVIALRKNECQNITVKDLIS